MQILEKLIHLLIPRESNNHKAKILHSSSLFIVAFFIVLLQVVINYIPKIRPNILGYSANISIQDVINLTNQKRAEAGLSALTGNQNLSNAAYTKGRDMIDKDYWAHVSPDGTQPWKFFNQFGYRYKYAGENLARDFSNAETAINAWMNSPTHRENILNPKYKEIGIGVVEGDLAGSDTTIIVQFFGTTYSDIVREPIAQAVKTEASKVPEVSQVEEVKPMALIPEVKAEVETPKPNQQFIASPVGVTRSTSLMIISLLIMVLIIDAVLVTRRKINRISGRTFSHVAFLLTILAIIVILKSGKII